MTHTPKLNLFDQKEETAAFEDVVCKLLAAKPTPRAAPDNQASENKAKAENLDPARARHLDIVVRSILINRETTVKQYNHNVHQQLETHLRFFIAAHNFTAQA